MIFGCIVLTRPSSISGKPVTSLTSRTGMPASRRRRAVPPVEISSAPRSREAAGELGHTGLVGNADEDAHLLIMPARLCRALAAAQLQREVVGIAPVLVDIGIAFEGFARSAR